MKVWDRIYPMDQRVILSASATNRTSIPALPPSILHRFLNVQNSTALQVDCALTYIGQKLDLPTSFFQALLQGHIMAIPDTDALKGLLPFLTPPSSAGPANADQQVMRIQVLLLMGQDCLSKEEAGELLDQRVHVLASTQDLRHYTSNVFKIAGN